MPGWNRELIRKKKITRWKEGRKERGDGRQKREKERDRDILRCWVVRGREPTQSDPR